MSDLAKIMPQNGKSLLYEGNLTSKQRFNEQNYNTFQDAIATNNGYGNSSTLMGGKKGPPPVNFHRKLQDEFDKYDQLFKEHYQLNNKEATQEQPANGQMINQIISNQFVTKQVTIDNKPISQPTYYQVGTSGTPKHYNKTLARDESQNSENLSPMLKFKNRQTKMSFVLTNQTSTQTNANQSPGLANSRLSKLSVGRKNGNNQSSLQTSQNQSNNQSQKAMPKPFEQRLTKSERDNILISAITNSIKFHNEQDEAKLLEIFSEDQLWKECTYLLKEYFNFNFLNEIRENKVLILRLYKLYLLHSLSLNFKQIEENQTQGVNIQYYKKQPQLGPLGYADDSNNTNAKGIAFDHRQDSDDDEDVPTGNSGTNGQRGINKVGSSSGQANGAFKQKMNGFIKLLQEILSPAEKESLELDSVFQIKSLVKSYYEKKGQMSGNLNETLYAMMCERPAILDSKKKYFFNSHESPENMGQEVKKIRNLYFELEQGSQLSSHIGEINNKVLAQQNTEELNKVLARIQLQKKKKQTRMAKMNSERRESWIEKIQNDEDFIQSYQKGVIPMLHPDHHKFREQAFSTGFTYKNANDSIYKDNFIYHRKYFNQPWTDQNYNDKQPHLTNEFRQRSFIGEVTGHYLKFQPKTQINRVHEVIKNHPRLSTESSINFREPYVENSVQFRLTTNSIQNPIQSSWNKGSANSSIIKGSGEVKDTFNHQFDSTISKDITWKRRMMESQSLRQRAHLNQSLRIKEASPQDNIQSLTKTGSSRLISTNIEDPEVTSSTATPDKKVIRFFKFQEAVNNKYTSQQKRKMLENYQELSQIISESSPKNMRETNRSSIQKPKEQIINLSQVLPEDAASFLNNKFDKSFTNSWQYQIVRPLDNKRFSIKEELNESHILSELDKIKTYYSSLGGKIAPAITKYRSQISSPSSQIKSGRKVYGLTTEGSKNAKVNSSMDVNASLLFSKRNQRNRKLQTASQCSPNSSPRDIFGKKKNLKENETNSNIKEVIGRYFEKIQSQKAE